MLFGTELAYTVDKEMVHVNLNENEPVRIPKSMQNFLIKIERKKGILDESQASLTMRPIFAKI